MIALLALFIGCPGLVAERPAVPTLHTELARHCVSAGVFVDAYQEITAHAAASQWPWVLIAFYHATGTDAVADELHVRMFDRVMNVWRKTSLGREVHGGAAVAGIKRVGDEVFLHLQARKGTPVPVPGAFVRTVGGRNAALIVLDAELQIRRRLNGTLLLVLSDGRSVYQADSGTAASLRLYSPHTNSDRNIYSAGRPFDGAAQFRNVKQLTDTTLQFEVAAGPSPGRPQGPSDRRSYIVVCDLLGFITCTSDKPSPFQK
jgi:hypothetical protein